MGLKEREEAALFLEGIFKRYNRRFIDLDPVVFPHQFKNQEDQEIAGFLAALLSFGNVKTILSSVKKALALMKPLPSSFLFSFDPKSDPKGFKNLGHRWVRGKDIFLLFSLLKKILHQYGSIQNLFLEGYDPGEKNIQGSLEQFSARCKRLASCDQGLAKPARGFSYFFPSPKGKSACKRLNMFLRWMVRPPDGVDLGLWKGISPSQLIIPLDTHIHQFARRFHLSRRKTPCWEMALEVTEFLKSLDPSDPVKYDFAICHYGMEFHW